MLLGLLEKKRSVTHMFGEMDETEDLRERCPSSADWQVAQAIVDVLNYPCQVVVKAQDEGECWLINVCCQNLSAN